MTSSRPAHRAEGLVALDHALRLGASLLVTTAVALGVRVLVPRVLGPGPFGELRLAESYGDLLLVLLTFGIDSQLRREAAIDPARTLRSLGGLTLLRIVLGTLAMAAGIAMLHRTGASRTVVVVFLGLGVSQVLAVLNNTYAAFEHAAGDVRWLARTNIGMKVVWAAMTVLALSAWRTGLAVAVAGLAVEAARFAWLTRQARRQHGATLRVDLRLASGLVLTSVPLFVNALGHTFYARIGTGWLGAVSGPVEVGLYGAASNVASLALLGMPILTWVLVPSAARAAAASRDGMRDLVAGALRISLLGAVPVALACAVAAPQVLAVCFGPGFADATPMLRALAPTFALAYLSTVCAITLLQEGRAWTMAAVSLAGVAASVPLNAWLIGGGAAKFGVPGGGTGAAWATLLTEVAVTVVLAGLSRRSWSAEPRLLRTAVGLVAATVPVAAAAWLRPVSGVLPALAAALVCVVSAWVAGGVNRDDLAFVFQAWQRRRAPAPVLAVEAS